MLASRKKLKLKTVFYIKTIYVGKNCIFKLYFLHNLHKKVVSLHCIYNNQKQYDYIHSLRQKLERNHYTTNE
jgi:hypothetical protein